MLLIVCPSQVCLVFYPLSSDWLLTGTVPGQSSKKGIDMKANDRMVSLAKVRLTLIVNVLGLVALAAVSETKRTVQLPILALVFANGLLYWRCLNCLNRKLGEQSERSRLGQ